MMRRTSGQDTAKQYADAASVAPTWRSTLRLPGSSTPTATRSSARSAGRAAGGDFWAWRETMLAEAERQTPELVRSEYERTYREMLAAGYTAVGEFHYLGVPEAYAAAEAAAAAGIDLVLLHVAYARGGLPRFRQDSVGGVHRAGRGPARRRAPRSESPPTPCARARPTGSRRSAATPLPRRSLCTSMPTSSRRRSRSASPSTAAARSSSSRAPAAWRERTTVVHATHADGAELDLLASTGATICACPTTEADLGDGFLPAERVRTRAIPLCIGSDSNVRIDPFEELRELEGIARRQTRPSRRLLDGRAVCVRTGRPAPTRSASTPGRRSRSISAIPRWPASIAEHVPAALVAGCGADVVVRE